MTPALRKALRVCPRCPVSGVLGMCEFHREQHARREAKRIEGVRARRRRLGLCAYCAAMSEKYRCETCAMKRKRWDCKVRDPDQHHSHP